MQTIDWFYNNQATRKQAEDWLTDLSVKPIHGKTLPIQTQQLSIIDLVNVLDGVLVYNAIHREQLVTAHVVPIIKNETDAAEYLLQLSVVHKLRTFPHIRHIMGAGYLTEPQSMCKVSFMPINLLRNSNCSTTDTDIVGKLGRRIHSIAYTSKV